MSAIDEEIARLLHAITDADADEYSGPKDWQRPTWWRAEFDREIPCARYRVTSAERGRSLLYQTRHPEKYAATQRASKEKRDAEQAAAKVLEFTRKTADLEKRVAELKHALAIDFGCRTVKRTDGTPCESWWEVDEMHRQERDKLARAEKALRRWLGLVPKGEPSP